MLRDKIFFISLLCLIAILLGEILYIVWMPIILQIHFKMTPIGNGWTMIFPAIGLATGSYISSQLCKVFEKELIILLGIFAIDWLDIICQAAQSSNVIIKPFQI